MSLKIPLCGTHSIGGTIWISSSSFHHLISCSRLCGTLFGGTTRVLFFLPSFITFLSFSFFSRCFVSQHNCDTWELPSAQTLEGKKLPSSPLPLSLPFTTTCTLLLGFLRVSLGLSGMRDNRCIVSHYHGTVMPSHLIVEQLAQHYMSPAL